MLTGVLAHVGQPPAPYDLWGAWNAQPVLVTGLLLAVWAYLRGRARGRRRHDWWRAGAFAAAVGALGVALLSPLDALSGALASAHMVQHLLLVLVAAPLLALSAPASTILRGTPPPLRWPLLRSRRRLRAWGLGALQHPACAWLLHVAVLWSWHAAALYDAALRHPAVHALEHATFLATALLFWRVVLGTRSPARASHGLGIMLAFGMALQGTFLSVLLTFARAPWYAGYATTTAPWGLTPLADQQLAGVLMWIPGGLVYLAVALGLLAAWIRATESPGAARSGAGVRMRASQL